MMTRSVLLQHRVQVVYCSIVVVVWLIATPAATAAMYVLRGSEAGDVVYDATAAEIVTKWIFVPLTWIQHKTSQRPSLLWFEVLYVRTVHFTHVQYITRGILKHLFAVQCTFNRAQ